MVTCISTTAVLQVTDVIVIFLKREQKDILEIKVRF